MQGVIVLLGFLLMSCTEFSTATGSSKQESAPERISNSDGNYMPIRPKTPFPLPRDPDLAIKEEYDRAVSEGSCDALDLFVVRHPKSELAQSAKRMKNNQNCK